MQEYIALLSITCRAKIKKVEKIPHRSHTIKTYFLHQTILEIYTKKQIILKTF